MSFNVIGSVYGILRRIAAVFILLFVFLMVNGQVRPTRQSALEAFENADYLSAYSQYLELLANYPKDPAYLYYTGVCMVNLSLDPEESTRLLTEARKVATVSRPIPLESSFYLARSNQQSGFYPQATTLFNEYTEKAGRKSARDMGVTQYLEQCARGEGKISAKVFEAVTANNVVDAGKQTVGSYSSSVSADKPIVGADKLVAVTEPVVGAKPKSTELPVSAVERPSFVANPVVSIENLPVVVEIPDIPSERQFLPTSYDKLLAEAVGYQMRTDSIVSLIDNLEESIDTQDAKQKTEIRRQIASNRTIADSLQAIADEKFEEAQSLINRTEFSSGNVIAQSSTQATLRPATQPDSTQPGAPNTAVNRPAARPAALPTTAKSAAQTAVNQPAANQPTAQPTIQSPQGAVTLFKVDGSLASSRDAITVNPELPKGLLYRIQVAILSNPATLSVFKGLSPVYGLRDEGATATKYYVGLFRTREAANTALIEVKKAGFKDAFIVSIFSGAVVSSDRAASLEKEWSNVPFSYAEKGVVDVVADTVPPVLSYRVELLRTKQPVKEDVLNGMKRIADRRGLDIFTLEDGTIVYLVGQFVSLESAEDYADLVSRNGYPDAKVAAWLGRKEIPMETAKELFNMI